jgi:hypothetical protein
MLCRTCGVDAPQRHPHQHLQWQQVALFLLLASLSTVGFRPSLDQLLVMRQPQSAAHI